jgi:cytochrome c peroxidase
MTSQYPEAFVYVDTGFAQNNFESNSIEMKKSIILSLSALTLLSLFNACQKDNEPPMVIDPDSTLYYPDSEAVVLKQYLTIPLDEPYDYSFDLPDYMPASNRREIEIKSAKATLGRVLFYDKNLSKNGTVSCASCHIQAFAFSDTTTFSKGFLGQQTRRNSYPIPSSSSTQNYYHASDLFWDARSQKVAWQTVETMENHVEMGIDDWDELLEKLSNEPYYKILLKKVSSSYEEFNQARLGYAIQEFVESFKSIDSRFDAAYADASLTTFDPYKNIPTFTAQENLGKNLFMDNCASCHGQSFTLPQVQTACNGLDMEYTDNGVGEIYPSGGAYNGIFKVPTLRNVELTGPYMHDGRFKTLEEVIDFYDTDIANHPNLHPLLKNANGTPIKLNFTQQEKEAIVAFLKTTTDSKLMVDDKFSNPFK